MTEAEILEAVDLYCEAVDRRGAPKSHGSK